jgi:nitrate reductase NapAB chaperone NapD
MPTPIPVLTEEQKQFRRELEAHLLSYPAVEFVGVNGSPDGKLVITLGGERTGVIMDLLPGLLGDSRLQNLSYQLAVVRGQTAKK